MATARLDPTITTKVFFLSLSSFLVSQKPQLLRVLWFAQADDVINQPVSSVCNKNMIIIHKEKKT